MVYSHIQDDLETQNKYCKQFKLEKKKGRKKDIK